MKIYSVANHQSFKGLVGGLVSSKNKEKMPESYDVNINYYPFKDESQHKIDTFVRKNTIEKEEAEGKSFDDNEISQPIGADIKSSFSCGYLVREPLTFTKEEYDDYLQSPSDLTMQKRFEIRNVLEEIKREGTIKSSF